MRVINERLFTCGHCDFAHTDSLQTRQATHACPGHEGVWIPRVRKTFRLFVNLGAVQNEFRILGGHSVLVPW